MYNVFEVLYLAQTISVLTYIIGALFYALPIPVYGIKRWAPRLVSDGIYVSVWANIYGLIIYLMNYLLNILGASWSNFFSWLNEALNVELNIYVIVRGSYALAALSPDPSISVMVSPFTVFLSFLTGLIYTLETIMTIAELIYKFAPLFVAIGILLMSLPFRVGRAAGASLIAASIVFYSGLPYLPNFLSALDMNIAGNFSALLPSNPSDLLQYLATAVVPTLISATILGPLIYLGILAGLSIGLGNAIGGSSRLPFPIDIF